MVGGNIIGGIGPLRIAAGCNGENSEAQNPGVLAKFLCEALSVHFRPDVERNGICHGGTRIDVTRLEPARGGLKRRIDSEHYRPDAAE